MERGRVSMGTCRVRAVRCPRDEKFRPRPSAAPRAPFPVTFGGRYGNGLLFACPPAFPARERAVRCSSHRDQESHQPVRCLAARLEAWVRLSNNVKPRTEPCRPRRLTPPVIMGPSSGSPPPSARQPARPPVRLSRFSSRRGSCLPSHFAGLERTTPASSPRGLCGRAG